MSSTPKLTASVIDGMRARLAQRQAPSAEPSDSSIETRIRTKILEVAELALDRARASSDVKELTAVLSAVNGTMRACGIEAPKDDATGETIVEIHEADVEDDDDADGRGDAEAKTASVRAEQAADARVSTH